MPKLQIRPNPRPAPGYAWRAALKARPTMLSMGGGYINKVLGYGPTAYWPLDQGASSQPNFLVFNGTTTKINCASGASLDDLADNAFTAEAWIRADSTGGSFAGRVIAKRGASPYSVGWDLAMDSTEELYATVQCATTDALSRTNVGSIVDSQWHHVTMFFNDAGDRKIYLAIDGNWASAYETQTAGVGAIVSDAAVDLFIGSLGDVSYVFDGAIGWVRISNNDRHTHGVNFTPPARLTIPTVDANTVALWPMNEGYGSVAGDIGANNNDGTITAGSWSPYPPVLCATNPAMNGTAVGVTWGNDSSGPFGTPAPFFDGVNDLVDVNTATLAAAWNVGGAEWSVMAWWKVANVGVWTDAAWRKMYHFQDDANNEVYFAKSAANNTLYHQWIGGAVNENYIAAGYTTTGWNCSAVTRSEAADEVRWYENGVWLETDTVIGNWASAGAWNWMQIGASNNVAFQVWHGWLAHVALFPYVLGQPAITDLAKP